MLDRLAARAGLRHRPRLYYIPSRMLNAFAVGERDDAVIALTDGMLRTLSLRELAGVLGHELSHIRNNDLWLMGLADLVGRLTRLMTLARPDPPDPGDTVVAGRCRGFALARDPAAGAGTAADDAPAAGALAGARVRGGPGCGRADRRSDGARLRARQARALPARGVGADPDAGLPAARAVALALASADRRSASRSLQALQAAAPAAPAFEETMPWPGARTAVAQQPRGRMLGFWY